NWPLCHSDLGHQTLLSSLFSSPSLISSSSFLRRHRLRELLHRNPRLHGHGAFLLPPVPRLQILLPGDDAPPQARPQAREARRPAQGPPPRPHDRNRPPRTDQDHGRPRQGRAEARRPHDRAREAGRSARAATGAGVDLRQGLGPQLVRGGSGAVRGSERGVHPGAEDDAPAGGQRQDGRDRAGV
ncbi:hypothetical protein ACHAWF_002967, partial [Thalassiosira exigua]